MEDEGEREDDGGDACGVAVVVLMKQRGDPL
jgi:hypothetical protein